MSNLHAHFESYSTDCDGAISRDWIVTMNEEELAGQDQDNWFGEIEFHDRVVSAVVNTYSSFRGGRLEVTLDDEYGLPTLEWSEATEEGGRHTSATLCKDDCNTTYHGYRDHRAEEMGY